MEELAHVLSEFGHVHNSKENSKTTCVGENVEVGKSYGCIIQKKIASSLGR